jgi:hypothetical protein
MLTVSSLLIPLSLDTLISLRPEGRCALLVGFSELIPNL